MFISFLRTLILYPLLLLVVRLMGKRQLGQMEPAEFVVAMLLADLAAVPMQDIGIPLQMCIRDRSGTLQTEKSLESAPPTARHTAAEMGAPVVWSPSWNFPLFSLNCSKQDGKKQLCTPVLFQKCRDKNRKK